MDRQLRILNLGAGHGSAPLVGLNAEGEAAAKHAVLEWFRGN